MICSRAIPVPFRITPPQTDQQASIAATALTLLGIPFRLYGRSVETGLDCVGLVARCLSAAGDGFEAPLAYGVRGMFEDRAKAFFDDPRFQNIDDASRVVGDILLVRPGSRQVHFAVLTPHGAVHAHMALGRVVLTPLPLPYCTIAQWRFQGD